MTATSGTGARDALGSARGAHAWTAPARESDEPGGPPEATEPRPVRTLCLGEALVDLICEREVEDPADADAFIPHFGGAVANVAVVAARAGARVALAGGAGDDPWGRWLRERLERDGVETTMFDLLAEARTPIALVTVGPRAEPAYQVYGEAIGSVAHALDGRLEDAVRASAAVLFSSNTLVGEEERDVTMRARELALELERPVIFDANVRLHRWRTRAEAAATANACVPGAFLVRANRDEAALMTGEDDPERAAVALLKAGARMVVITLGAAGALLRGLLSAQAPGVQARVISTVGAGDVLTGILVARLAASDFYPPAAAASLREAVAAAARACEHWGAVD